MLLPTMTTTRLKPKQFDALLAKSRLKEDAAAIARAVLVDGQGYTEAALAYGKRRQFAYQAVQRLLAVDSDEVHTYEGSPDSFVAIDEIVERHRGRKMLTRHQFNAISKLTSQEPHTIELAKGVLVDGLENIELAKQYGVARHLVWQAAQRFMKYFDPATEAVRVYKGSAAMFEEIDSSIEGKRET